MQHKNTQAAMRKKFLPRDATSTQLFIYPSNILDKLIYGKIYRIKKYNNFFIQTDT